jgi:hypothetical protein
MIVLVDLDGLYVGLLLTPMPLYTSLRGLKKKFEGLSRKCKKKRKEKKKKDE